MEPAPSIAKGIKGFALASIGPLCLLPLLVVWVLWAGAPQSSFQMFVTLELIVLVSGVLAIVFSLMGFRKRSSKLKFLNIATIVLACILGFLVGFSLL
jgi:uncharacterized membrane protein